MKHVRIIVAVPAVATGIVLAGASQASAREVDPEWSHNDPVVVIHEPGPAVPVDDTANELRQAGASAIGGSVITLAVLWAYRRRHPDENYDSYESY